MTKDLLLQRSLLAVAALLVASSNATPIDTVVLVVVDDLGSSDLGFTGSGIRTPVIDALRNEGTLLTQYHVYRACSPTRAALLTSRYVTRYGFQSGVLEPKKAYGLFLNETLLPQRLTALGDGWTSHAIGKVGESETKRDQIERADRADRHIHRERQRRGETQRPTQRLVAALATHT